MPTWSSTGKLCKKGSYCTWEAVVAHVEFLRKSGTMSDAEQSIIKTHIEHVCGTCVSAAPHFTQLSHIKGTITMQDFRDSCLLRTSTVGAVKISSDGAVFEIQIEPHTSCEDYLDAPICVDSVTQCFNPMRKKGQRAERELAVWHCNNKHAPLNQIASNLFKMQIHGNVILIHQSCEQSFFARERYVTFTKAQFEELFHKKRKRNTETQSLSPAAYNQLKGAMQQTLNHIEASWAKDAVIPAQTAGIHSVSSKAEDHKFAKAVKSRLSQTATVGPPQVLLQHLQLTKI